MKVGGAWAGMEEMPVDLTAVLSHLHGLIGTKIRVIINVYDQFFGAGFQDELVSVQTLRPGAGGIQLVLGSGHGFFLDSTDTEALLFRADGEEWLELRTGFGLTITIEAARR